MRHDHSSTKSHYGHLLIMAVLSFISMYVLMYAMVDRLVNVYPSFNQLYMAGLMTAPMVMIEITVMGSMYENKKVNAIILITSALVAVLLFVAIRQQTAIDDVQFLKSMIPHHAGAILMCNEASISDPEIGELCKGIVSGQQSEIDKMTAMLARLEQR
jgi:uncharacterized protein (DUF305 family)